MKTRNLPIATLVFTLALVAVFAWKPTTRTIAGPKLTKPASSTEATEARLADSYGKVPLSFEANRGQTDPRVKFLSRGSGYTLFLTGDEAVLSLRSPKPGVRSQKLEVRSTKGVLGHLSLVICKGRGTAPKRQRTKDQGQVTSSE